MKITAKFLTKVFKLSTDNRHRSLGNMVSEGILHFPTGL